MRGPRSRARVLTEGLSDTKGHSRDLGLYFQFWFLDNKVGAGTKRNHNLLLTPVGADPSCVSYGSLSTAHNAFHTGYLINMSLWGKQ